MVVGRSVAVTALLVGSAFGLLGPSGAVAQETMLVTYVARVCPSYDSITANTARNNIQESLRDLGADSAYRGGTLVDPQTEATNQPRCRPLPDWRFTLGRDYEVRAVSGSWGRLAKVTDEFPTQIETQSSVPLLDRNGNPTGSDLAGAVTIALTPEQTRLAARTSKLWVQGGLPDDPVLERLRPTERFGFGSLRCAIDGVNGDNVEWIAFPQGNRHVFCYAYYVQPPPPAGTIVVRKQVDAPAGTTAPSFDFTGNVSYEPGGLFELRAQPGAPAQQVFPRASQVAESDPPWRFREIEPAGWQRTGLSCESATGGSQTTIDQGTGEVAVRLGASDTVTCTYVNRLRPPLSGLILSKRTLDGIGSFPFDVTGPDQAQDVITTAREDVSVAGEPLTLAAGDYTIDERLPEPSPRGRWERTKVICDGQDLDASAPVPLTLAPDHGSACEFTNRFVPRGAIRLHKQTLGETGTVGFLVESRTDPALTLQQAATTAVPGRSVLATGDSTDRLPLGSYEIVETTPTTPGHGFWTLDSVICDGKPVGNAQGRAQVQLTAANPTVDCTYVNRFTPRGTPPRPRPSPPEESGGVLGAAAGPLADLQITKRVRPRTARPGQPVHYAVVITNRGPGTATRVVGTELVAADIGPLRLRPSKGRCRGGRHIRCVIGTLEPGERVVIPGDSRAKRLGRTRNVVAVGSATADRNLGDNRAGVTLTVRPRPRPSFTG